jgi:hypothetical protein
MHTASCSQLNLYTRTTCCDDTVSLCCLLSVFHCKQQPEQRHLAQRVTNSVEAAACSGFVSNALVVCQAGSVKLTVDFNARRRIS